MGLEKVWRPQGACDVGLYISLWWRFTSVHHIFYRKYFSPWSLLNVFCHILPNLSLMSTCTYRVQSLRHQNFVTTSWMPDDIWRFFSLQNCDRIQSCIFKQELSSCWDGRPFGHNRHGRKWERLLWGLGPHLTQCGLGRCLPLYQVASWSIQSFDHNCRNATLFRVGIRLRTIFIPSLVVKTFTECVPWIIARY